MSIIACGAVSFEKLGSSQLVIGEGLDAMRTITSPAALHDAAEIIRGALTQFSENGTARTVEFVLNHNFYSAPFVPYFFKLTAQGSLRKIEVGTPGYIRAIDHHPGVLSSSYVEASELESLADFFDG